MPVIRLLFLWHMHQPYYKDLVTGEYRLPWVRMHALKDYYGMVKLLDEFPGVHQTFNLVPSLLKQIQDYAAGTAKDPYLDVASKPAADLTPGEKELALLYLFQSNVQNLIGRYPRYRQLWDIFQSVSGAPEKASSFFGNSDIADLQVLSQLAWFDEFWLEDPAIKDLIKKGRAYTLEDQRFVIGKQKELIGRVVPAYAQAQRRGSIEISASPFYHPILPLICDTRAGDLSHAGITLPNQRFSHPEDARKQIERGLALHETIFGVRPKGMWPSEGSVSDEVLTIAHESGIEWAATDESVLSRSLDVPFRRDDNGKLDSASAERLYRLYRWEQSAASVHMVFRDHTLSDLIGFVYSGVPAKDAAEDFIRKIKASCAAVLEKGKDATVSIILDGENAWEYYPKSGREFLRRVYEGIQNDKSFAALTVSEAIAQSPQKAEKINSITPGSWINANFDIWIGAPEDNLAWDYLSATHDFFAEHSAQAPLQAQELAFEELLIAEGSDWNWWYGPEHHSANDRDFDELYRKHLANVYSALGADPPSGLAHPILGRDSKPQFSPQTAYISPRLGLNSGSYFDWLGAATYSADRRSSAMHGKKFLLDTGYAGIDRQNLYCRLDFTGEAADRPAADVRLALTIQSQPQAGVTGGSHVYSLEAGLGADSVGAFTLSENGQVLKTPDGLEAGLRKGSIFECQIPLRAIGIQLGMQLRMRFSLWHGQIPLDALPQDGFIEVQVIPEEDLTAVAYAKP